MTNQIVLQSTVCSTIKVEGMTCSACSSAVEKALRNSPGVESAQVALLRGTAQAVHDPQVRITNSRP